MKETAVINKIERMLLYFNSILTFQLFLNYWILCIQHTLHSVVIKLFIELLYFMPSNCCLKSPCKKGSSRNKHNQILFLITVFWTSISRVCGRKWRKVKGISIIAQIDTLSDMQLDKHTDRHTEIGQTHRWR